MEKQPKKVPATFLSSLYERAALSSSTAKSSGNSWPPSNETAWVGRKMCWRISIESFNIRQEQSNRILALKGNSGIIGWDGWVGINHWSSLYGVSPAVYEMEAHASSYFFFFFFTTQILLLLQSTLFSTCSVTWSSFFSSFFARGSRQDRFVNGYVYQPRNIDISQTPCYMYGATYQREKSRESLIFQQERYNLNGTLSLLLLNNPLHVLCTDLRHQPSER